MTKKIKKFNDFETDLNQLKNDIIDIPDFPKPGILFRDISTLLSQPSKIRLMVNSFYNYLKNKDIDIVVGLDARGFILGPMIADKLDVGFAMARKKGKAPDHYVYKKYDLEYGSNEMGLSPLIIKEGMRVHIHDDLLATGGSSKNIINIIESFGAIVDSISFIIELEDLNGKEILKEYDIYSLIKY